MENDLSDSLFFIVIFVIVLFLLIPGIGKNIQPPYQCAKHNGNYQNCVEAQNAGMGCSWYASCEKCISEQKAPSDICS